MATSCYGADFALEELEREFEEVGRKYFDVGIEPYEEYYCLLGYMNVFKQEFRFLTIFLDCIHKWSDSDEVVPNLGSFVIKIEATIEGIGNQMMEVKRASKLPARCSKIQRKNEHKRLMERISRLADLFTSLGKEVELLKVEIGEACDSLSTHSFQFRCPFHDNGNWKEFVKSGEFGLEFLETGAYLDGPLQKEVTTLKEMFRLIMDFLDNLADASLRNPRFEDVTVHVGSVAIRATLVSCHWWASRMDPDMEEGICIVLRNLHQKIKFTNPEFVDRLLKFFRSTAGNRTRNQVEMFVEHLLPIPEEHVKNHLLLAMPYTIHVELISLINSAVNVEDKYDENVQRFLIEVKEVAVEVAEYFLDTVGESGILLFNLLAKIWLIKIEIFIREQLNAGDNIPSLVAQINALNQGVRSIDLKERLRFVKNQFQDSEDGSSKNVNQSFTLMEEVSKVLESLDHSFRAKEITRKIVRNTLFKLLLIIVLFKAETILAKLSDNCKLFLLKDLIEPLYMGLKILIMFVRDQQQNSVDDGKLVFAHIEAFGRGVISVYYSFPIKNITEERISNKIIQLSHLLDKFKLIMVELKDIYIQLPRSNFPKTNGLGFVHSLLKKVRELLNCRDAFIPSVKLHIEDILKDLEFFKSFLRDISLRVDEVKELEDLGTRVTNLAYEVEYFIDSIMVGNVAELHCSLWLYHLLECTRLLKLQVTEVHDKNYDAIIHKVPQRAMISKAITQGIDEAILSLNDQEEVIIDRLTAGFLQRDVVSIIGMAGIGKTTLARKVFNSPRVVYHFHVCAWCYVSEIYEKRELLLQILSHITPPTDAILGMTHEDLHLKLYQVLKQKRYLIVMDDMWNVGAWDELCRSFPNDRNGSRILITSRHHDVALKTKAYSEPHPLRLLSDAESWDLLQLKIFREECCPEALIEAGKQISKSCKGLPLAIVAMAGVLERTDRQQNQWKEIAENLSSRIFDDPQKQLMDILELSYNHLPDYLKACFLYFGAFLEDENIPVRKLIWLWIAEGFVQESELKSIEELAEDLLMDLIDRSLVIFAQGRSNGGVKSCRIHDILRNLCLSKAKEENFLHLITCTGEYDVSFDGLDYGVDFEFDDSFNYMTYEDHRLCIHSKRKHFALSRPSGPYARSLLFFAINDMYPRCPYDISFISHNLRLLKVLDLECINMGSSFPTGFELLVNLRYLAVSGDIDSVPSSIDNLWNLAIFLVKGLKGKVELPDNIWRMARLRHLHVSNHAVFSFQHDKPSFKLDNLVTLSSPILFYGKNTNNILRQFPNLQKLRCIFLGSRENSQNCSQLPGLDVLAQLQSLKISCYGKVLHPFKFTFPLNLKKLTLSNFRLPWDNISVIGRLENLEVLKLVCRAFDGERWDMVEGEFCKLRFLKLDTLNIVKWNASSEHLPKLRHLVLHCCKNLEEIPSSFGELPTLQILEVQWCGTSVEESAIRIREEADEGLKPYPVVDHLLCMSVVQTIVVGSSYA